MTNSLMFFAGKQLTVIKPILVISGVYSYRKY